MPVQTSHRDDFRRHHESKPTSQTTLPTGVFLSVHQFVRCNVADVHVDFQQTGVANGFLSWFGISGPDWIGNPHYALSAIGF